MIWRSFIRAKVHRKEPKGYAVLGGGGLGWWWVNCGGALVAWRRAVGLRLKHRVFVRTGDTQNLSHRQQTIHS